MPSRDNGPKFASDVSRPRGGYRVLAEFKSKSNPGKYHEIRRTDSGELYCTCRGWIAAGKINGAGCTHFRQRPDLGAAAQRRVQVQAQGVAIGGRPAPRVEVEAPAPAAATGRYVEPAPPRAAPPPPSAGPTAAQVEEARRLRLPVGAIAAMKPAEQPAPPADAPSDWCPGWVQSKDRLEID